MPNASYHVIVATWVRLLTETWVEIYFFFVHFLYLLVRLLAETWVEILLQIKDLCATISSSPCGDVSWNGKQSKEYNRVIRFVSLRRRELKYTTPICKRLQSGSSSPYGDVSWNVGDSINDKDQVLFVSLRRRELKFLSTWGGNGILC